MPKENVRIQSVGQKTRKRRVKRSKPANPFLRRYPPGSILTAPEMTEYALAHRLRNPWGIMDEEEIKQTVSFAADYWRLEAIDLSDFSFVADPDFPNKSRKAHPILHYFNEARDGGRYCDVLDGLHRIGMAKACGSASMLAWVGHLDPGVEWRA